MTLEPIEISEVGWTPAPELTDPEAAELHAVYGRRGRLTVRRDPGESGWKVEGHGYAGAVTLSNGRAIRISTKVPIASLLHMLAYARGVHDFFLPESAFEKVEDNFEVVVAEFAQQTAELLRLGLHQGYIEHEDDDLRALRGRLMVATQIRRNFVLRDRFACRYVELTPDLTMNRALKLATFLASHFEYRQKRLNDSLQANLRLFGGVSLRHVEPDQALTVVLDRLTEGYRVPLLLAALIIGSVTLQDDVGTTPFASYLIDMKELFQQYVAAMLRDRLAGTGIRVGTQETRSLDETGRLEYRTDIELRRGHRCLIVADVKYKHWEGRPDPDDRNQAITYKLARDAQKVVLIYPEEAEDLFPKAAGVDIHVLGIDLSVRPSQLSAEVSVLIEKMLKGIDLSGSRALAS